MDSEIQGTVAFATVGRPQYAFDVFAVPLHDQNSWPKAASAIKEEQHETRLTDGRSVNYNAQFVSDSDADLLRHGILKFPPETSAQEYSAPDSPPMVAFVSERTGSARIHFNRGLQDHGHVQNSADDGPCYFYDRPTIKNGTAWYVALPDAPVPAKTAPASASAVYATCLRTGRTRRVSTAGVADFSPALSPSGELLAVASYGDRPWNLPLIDDLQTDIFICGAADGSGRRKVVDHAGWPAWADERTLFFHRRCADGWWSIFRTDIAAPEPSETRVTPAGVHCFTPAVAAGAGAAFLAVATRRPSSKFRHIEIFDLQSGEFVPVTAPLNPEFHHYNPFLSADAGFLGYHRFRGAELGETRVRFLEAVESPLPRLRLLRVNGSFPAFSADGSLVAFNPSLGTDDGGVLVVRADGRGGRACSVFDAPAFSLCWNPARSGLLYTSVGPIFAPDKSTVHIVSVRFDEDAVRGRQPVPVRVLSEVKILTKDGTMNNAFPSCSPDGRELVFRSGRDGRRNLYIMDAVDGEAAALRRLTEGPWVDTMPSWSPDGKWIAFSSDRDDTHQKGYFGVYLVRPDGSGLRRLPGGHEKWRINHVCFSPDSQWLLFTANLGAVSAEPISLPNQFQPYGELFVINLDGSSLLRRITFNAYEDGTPAWTCCSSSSSFTSVLDDCLDDSDQDVAADTISGEFDEPRWLVDP